MFLNISEDGGKITGFWGELTTWTHHLKLPERNSLAPTQLLWFLEFAIETY